MTKRELSREELFALVWERPTSEIAKELGISDVAVGKLCTRMQVPKPPRGYWARVQAGRIPRRPPLGAFREEIDRRRREAKRIEAAGTLSRLEKEFYGAATSELRARGGDALPASGGKLPNLDPNTAAQLLLLIQNHAQEWIKFGKVDAQLTVNSLHGSATKLVGRLLPIARPQVLIFESEEKSPWSSKDGPAVIVRLTASLQERIASLVRMIRDQQLQHVAMPLVSADHSWSTRYVYTPDSGMSFDSTLCVSATEVWVESMRRKWRDEDPPEHFGSARLALRDFMPIDYMPLREVELPNSTIRANIVRYRDRIQALSDAEQVRDMLSEAVHAMMRDVPNETLELTDKIWFGSGRPFRSARDALTRIEDELEQWDVELESERSAAVKSILGIEIGDTAINHTEGRSTRISVSSTTIYTSERGVSFVLYGNRFRKDGTLGKQQDSIRLHFKMDVKNAND